MYDKDVSRALWGIKDELHALVEASNRNVNITINGAEVFDAIDERIERFTNDVIKKGRMSGD